MGAGVVMRVEDDRIVVLFDEVGYKTLGLAAVDENDLLRPRRLTPREPSARGGRMPPGAPAPRGRTARRPLRPTR